MTDNPRPPANTMFARQQAEADEAYGAGGRFAKQSRPSVAGIGPIPHSGILVGPQWSDDCVPPEPPLGIAIDELPSLETVSGIDRQEALAIDAANRGDSDTEEEQP